MALFITRTFVLGVLFVLVHSQTPTQSTGNAATTSGQQILNPSSTPGGGANVNQVSQETPQTAPIQETRASDIPEGFLASQAQQQVPTAQGSGSFTPIGFTGLGVPAAWQIQQPVSAQAQPLPVSGQFPAQLPVQVPVQVPGQVLGQVVQTPQPLPTQASMSPSTSAAEPVAPTPTPDPFNMFGGAMSPLGLGMMGGEGMGGGLFGGGGDLFGGLGGAMGGGMGGGMADLFGGGGGGGGGGSGGGLFGGLLGGGGGGTGGTGGLGGGNFLQTMMLMRLLSGGDAPDPPARPTRGRGARGGRTNPLSQMSPLQRLALMELRRLMGGNRAQGGPGPRGPGPNNGMGPPPHRDYPPNNYQQEFRRGPNHLSTGYKTDLQSPVVRGPPPPSFRGGRTPISFGGPGRNGIPPPPPAHGRSRVARSMHTVTGPLPTHPEVLTGKAVVSSPNSNNQGQSPEPVEREPPQPQETPVKKPKLSPPPKLRRKGARKNSIRSGTDVSASDTQFNVFGTKGPQVASKSIQKGSPPSMAPSSSSFDVTPVSQPVQGTASAPFDISASRDPKIAVGGGVPVGPATPPVLGTAGEIYNPIPNPTPTQASAQFGSTSSFGVFPTTGGMPSPTLASIVALSNQLTSKPNLPPPTPRSSSPAVPKGISQLINNPLFMRRLLLNRRPSPMMGMSPGIGNADARADRADRMADIMDNMQSMNPLQRMMFGGGGGGGGGASSGLGALLGAGMPGLGGAMRASGGGSGNSAMLSSLAGFGGMPGLGGEMSGLGGGMSGLGTMSAFGRGMNGLGGGMPGLGGAGGEPAPNSGSGPDILSTLLGTGTNTNPNEPNAALTGLKSTRTSNSGIGDFSSFLGAGSSPRNFGGLSGLGGMSPFALMGGM